MPLVSTEVFVSASFDYIVVGAGTAGLSLAVRLSEDPNTSVGVIEAGGYDKDVPEINVPGNLGRLITDPKFDWTFWSTPQAHANDRIILQPRGKALGGSSMLNFQCLFRPAKEEYDVLEELGNKGWNWENLMECTKRSENIQTCPLSPEEQIKYAISPKPEFHGVGGPIQKSFPFFYTDMHSMVIDALEELGVPRNPEAYGGDLTGTFTCFTSIDPRNATRSYSASGYYEPNSKRGNLMVLIDAHVSKIILENGPEDLKRCTGVEFIKDGKTYTTQAPRQDVILSAGSFKTPHILELSGVGNKDILGTHGIECKIDLPGVGENLQDHLFVPTIAEIHDKYESMDQLVEPEVFAKHVELYKQQKGFLAGFTSPVFSFLPARWVAKESEISSWLDSAEKQCARDVAAAKDSDIKRGLEKQFDLQKRWFDDLKHPQVEVINIAGYFRLPTYPMPPPGKRHNTLLCALSHPFSRGTVHLGSSNPLEPPIIDPRYFSNSADLEVFARGVDFTLRLWESDVLKGAVKELVVPNGVPKGNWTKPEGSVGEGIGEADVGRLEAIKEFIREIVSPVFHPVGTASMLPREDGGVVDADLRVYGTVNVRVADVSILPLELSCHIQSAAYTIAEKAALILRNHL